MMMTMMMVMMMMMMMMMLMVMLMVMTMVMMPKRRTATIGPRPFRTATTPMPTTVHSS